MTFKFLDSKSRRPVQTAGSNGHGAGAIVFLMMSLVFGPVVLIHVVMLVAASQSGNGLGRIAGAVQGLLPQVFGVN
jgi:hypothetical protein